MFRLSGGRFSRRAQRVVASDQGVDISESDGVRGLHLGSVTLQSAMRLSAPFDLELAYTRGIMAFLLLAPQARHVLAIGLGGGSIPKFIHHYLPQLQTTVVEINPQVIQVARHHFLLPPDDARLQVIEADGVDYLRQQPASAEVLIVDAFDSQGLPPEFCTQQFFDSCAAALLENGLMAINLWGSDSNFDVYLQRIEQTFSSRVLVMPTGHPGNIIVFGLRGPPAELRWNRLRERARALQKNLGIEFLEFVRRLRDNNPASTNRLII